MARNKKPFFVNMYERDDKGNSTWVGGYGKRAQAEMARRAAKAKELADRTTFDECSRCHGSPNGPNPRIPERKCKKCDGMGYIPVLH